MRHCRSLDMPPAQIKRLIDLSADAWLDALVRARLLKVRANRVAVDIGELTHAAQVDQ